MDAEIDLKGTIGIIRRQMWLILVTVFATFIVAIAFLYLITPKYTATALVFVDTAQKNILDATNALANPNADTARIESEVGILKSSRVLLDVIRDNNLATDAEFISHTSLKERILSWLNVSHSAPPTPDEEIASVLEKFTKAVSINRSGSTYLINISVTSVDPAKAAKLANAIAETYIEAQIGAKVASILAARNAIENRVPAASAAIVENEKRFDSYINENIDRLERSGSLGLRGLRAELENINAKRSAEAARIAAIQQALHAQDFTSLASELKSNGLEQLQREYSALVARIAKTAGNTDSTGLEAERAKLNAQMQQVVVGEMSGLQQSLSLLQVRADDIRSQIRQVALQGDLPPEVLTEFLGLQQSAENARAQYQNLLRRLQDLDAQVTLQLPDSRIASAAMVPIAASYPNRTLILGLALLFSVGLGLGLAILREYFIGGFVEEDQIEAVLKLPLSTIVPRQSRSDELAAISSLSNLMVTAPLSLFAESIRRLRLSLDLQERKRPLSARRETGEGQIIMVSSALPDEGKSTVALSLARAYALIGKRTLLIDCDLRKPSINRHLNIEPDYDFIDYLRQDRNTATLNSLISRDPMTGLTVLLGSRRSEIATDELVMGEKMKRILASARRYFDYIVLDTPPVEPVVDSLYLARYADMIVFVIKWASTPQSSAKHSVNALKENRSSHTGIVAMLNQQEHAKLSSKYSYSNYYTG